MPAFSIMMSFDDCETDGLSSSSCTIFFYYTTIRKSSIYIYIYIVITNVSQNVLFAYLLLVTIIFISFNY